MIINSKNIRPLILSSVIATLLAACGESTSNKAGANYAGGETVTPTPTPTPDTDFNQQNLIANLTDNVIAPAYQAFEQLTEAQTTAVENFCQTPTIQSHKAAQDAWRSAMAKWQQIEVMQIGPLTNNSSTLRNNIYSWPITSSCGVDQDLMYFEQGTINAAPYDISKRTATRRGLDSVEYLLFNENLEHSCSSPKDILSTWSAKTSSERQAARCNFAIEVAEDLNSNASILVTAWSGSDGYGATLKQAGQQDSPFSDVHAGVNAISDALFYIDQMAKDEKLGTPLGLFSNDCGGVGSVCVQNVESPYSDNSIDNLINNLIGFKNLFNGQGSDATNTLGFDDYLIDVNDSATATQIMSNTDAAITDLQSYSDSLATSITNDSATAEATHAKVKKVTDQLKVDFINSLALKLPQTAAGDND